MSTNYLDTRDLYLEWCKLVDRKDDEDQIDPLEEDEVERCNLLADLFAQIGDSAGIHGGTLIPDSDFVEYAEDLATDIIDADFSAWPMNNIDWEAAADDLRADYTTVTFDSEDFLWRE